MALGPIEIVVIGFPGNQFSGLIVPELERLVEAGTVTIVDGLLAIKEDDGSTSIIELSEVGGDSEAAGLAAVLDHVEGLISDEDAEAFTSQLEPGTSAAILAFEHSWMKPIRDAVVESGGVLLDSVRIPGAVIEEILATVPHED